MPNHLLACRPCWLRLPVQHRMVLDRTYRFRLNLPGNWHKAIRTCIQWYKDNPPEVADGGVPNPSV